MKNNFIEGIKFGFGILAVFLLFFTIVFAAGFHSASDIIGRVFQGNYTFNGTVDFTSSTIIGLGRPETFTFTSVTSADILTNYTSNSVNLTGFVGNISFRVEGDNVSIVKNSIDTLSKSIIAEEGDEIQIRFQTPNTYEYSTLIDVYAGTYSTTWNVTTGSEVTEFSITLSSSTNNYNLSNVLTSTYSWDGVTVVNVSVTINSGVQVGSASISTPSFTTGVLPEGSVVYIINSGEIIGKGGNGNGQNGGVALETYVPYHY